MKRLEQSVLIFIVQQVRKGDKMNWTRRGFLSSLLASPLLTRGASLSANESSEKSTGETAESNSSGKRLVFQDGRFKILQLTDLHLNFSEEERIRKAGETLELIRKLLAVEKPDLTILTGDIITSDPVGLSGGLAEAWKRVGEPFAEAAVPFAAAFGNHDHERKESAAEQLAMIQASPWNVTRSDDPSLPGAGNCSLPIYGADGRPRRRIWLFDSHNTPNRQDLSTYDWIQNAQIQWYRRESEKIESAGHGREPGLAFFHIPLPEYWKIHHAEGTLGSANEDVCSPELNSGLFTAFVERGDIEGIFVGHDHVNDYIARYKGIALAYGRKTGVDSYGELACGGRIIELEEKNAGFKTSLTVRGERFFDFIFTPAPPRQTQV